VTAPDKHMILVEIVVDTSRKLASVTRVCQFRCDQIRFCYALLLITSTIAAAGNQCVLCPC
jgi:hypothetical protein